MSRDRVALVTGAGSGIGRAIAHAFAEKGATTVVVADIDQTGGEETVAQLRHDGVTAQFVQVDVADPGSVQAMVDTVMSDLGRLDWAANNAGIQGEVASTVDLTPENFDRVIGVNLKGVWLCMKYEIPAMLTGGGGAIVNTSSATAVVSTPGIAHYCATKHGIVGLTKTAALEYSAAGVRVNAICPGVIPTPLVQGVIDASPEIARRITDFHPIGRLGRPEEIGKAAAWLCTDDASFVTGHALLVDGGSVIA